MGVEEIFREVRYQMELQEKTADFPRNRNTYGEVPIRKTIVEKKKSGVEEKSQVVPKPKENANGRSGAEKKIGNFGEKAVVQNPPYHLGILKVKMTDFVTKANFGGKVTGIHGSKINLGRTVERDGSTRVPLRGTASLEVGKEDVVLGTKERGSSWVGGETGAGGPGVPPPTHIPAIPSQAPPLVL